jgi:hypothetical protein
VEAWGEFFDYRCEDTRLFFLHRCQCSSIKLCCSSSTVRRQDGGVRDLGPLVLRHPMQEPLVGLVIATNLEIDEEASFEEPSALTDTALGEGEDST